MEEVTFKLGLGSRKYSKLELAWGGGGGSSVGRERQGLGRADSPC